MRIFAVDRKRCASVAAGNGLGSTHCGPLIQLSQRQHPLPIPSDPAIGTHHNPTRPYAIHRPIGANVSHYRNAARMLHREWRCAHIIRLSVPTCLQQNQFYCSGKRKGARTTRPDLAHTLLHSRLCQCSASNRYATRQSRQPSQRRTTLRGWYITS